MVVCIPGIQWETDTGVLQRNETANITRKEKVQSVHQTVLTIIRRECDITWKTST